MSLTFNSVPLIFDLHREAAGFLERYQDLANRVLHGDFPFTSSWQSNPNGDETNIGLPVVNWPKGPPLRLNSLYWPCTGASRWAEGLFLCTGAQVSAIDSCAASSSGAALVWSGSSSATFDSQLGTDDRGISWAEMWPVNYHRVAGCQSGQELDPENILPGSTTHDYDLYLVHLADRRWWWQFVDAPEICEHLTSWTDLIDYLCDQLGIVAYFDPADLPLPAIYTTLGPHAGEWARPYHNAAQLLDAALECIGARLVASVDAVTGGPSIWKIHRVTGAEAIFQHNIANASAGFTNLRDQLAGTDCQQARNRALPGYVRAVFPKSRYGMLCGTCSTATPADPTDDTEQDCHESYHAIEHALQDYLDPTVYCPVQNTAKTVHIRGWADMGQCDDEDPMNNAELVALAAQVASDWFLYHRRQYDFTTVGPTAWDPCGYDDSIIHCFGAEYQDGLRGVAAAPSDDPRARDIVSEVVLEPQYRRDITSRIQSLPLNVGADVQLHNTNALELPGHLLVKMNEAVPAFQCEDSESESGEPGQVCGALGVAYRLVGELGCECLTPEKITALDSAHEGQDYLVWVYNTDCNEIAAGECVDTGPFKCCARRALVRCQTGSTLAVAIDCIVPGSTTGTALLENGSVVVIDNSDCLIMAIPGDTFPVLYGGCAPSCTWRPAGQFGTTRRVRVMNAKAGSSGNPTDCEGAVQCCQTLTAYVLEDAEDSSSGDDSGCCTSVESLCEIQVCNTTNRKIASDKDYEDMLATLIPGKTCLWYLHDQRRATRARAQLTAELCAADTAEVVNFEVLDVCTWQTPEEPLLVRNPYGLYGCANDLVELAWSEQTCDWEIVMVAIHTLPKPVLDLKCDPDPDKCEIQRTRPKYDSYGFSCKCDNSTEDDKCGLEGEFYDIAVGAESTTGSNAAYVATGFACGDNECELGLSTAYLQSGGAGLIIKSMCLFCAKPKDKPPVAIPGGLTLGGTGPTQVLQGTMIDVPVSVKAHWTAADSSSGDDCPTSPGGVISLSMETKRICAYCGGSGGGSGEPGDGTPIEFPITLAEVEALTEADFDCAGCPSLDVKTTSFYAFCVATEGAATSAGSCECSPCETSSS